MQKTSGSASSGVKSIGVADRNTPFPRNYWYVAAFSDEITRTPMRRRILNEDILFYRTEAGKAVAVQNRCPHRSFPLHKGFLKGDRIVCNYHGMEFNPDGSCAHVPSLGTAPKVIRLDRYPLEEDGPLVWIWMGDQAAPDYSRLVRQDWCTLASWRHVKGYTYMKANYLGLHENLMDLTHFPFLHSKWNFGRLEHMLAPTTIVEDGNSILQHETHEDIDTLPIFEAAGLTGRLNRTAYHRVEMPGMHQGWQVTTDSSEPVREDVQHIIHIMTPETQNTTHYLWAVAFRAEIVDEKLAAQMATVIEAAFMEDKVALEEIEEVYSRDHRPGYRERLIKTDEGGVRVLRLIARLADEEQQHKKAAAIA